VSENWTSKPAKESHHFSNNFYVHTVAEADWPFETVRIGMDHEYVIVEHATSAQVRTVPLQEDVERLFPQWSLLCGQRFLVSSVYRGKHSACDIRMERRMMSTEPDDIAERQGLKSGKSAKGISEKEGNLFEFFDETGKEAARTEVRSHLRLHVSKGTGLASDQVAGYRFPSKAIGLQTGRAENLPEAQRV